MSARLFLAVPPVGPPDLSTTHPRRSPAAVVHADLLHRRTVTPVGPASGGPLSRQNSSTRIEYQNVKTHLH